MPFLRTWVLSPNSQLFTPAKNDDMAALGCELETDHAQGILLSTAASAAQRDIP
jgi:hypothetical protein